MKVNIAAQTLSESVASTIDFCREDLKLPQFEVSAPTTEFIRLFDKIFDALNYSNYLGRRFKCPISLESENLWMPLFIKAIDYISNITLKDGTYIVKSR